jgi:hypothetical protein
METGAFSLLSPDADARAIERVLEIEFVTFVPTEYTPSPPHRGAGTRANGGGVIGSHAGSLSSG